MCVFVVVVCLFYCSSGNTHVWYSTRALFGLSYCFLSKGVVCILGKHAFS